MGPLLPSYTPSLGSDNTDRSRTVAVYRLLPSSLWLAEQLFSMVCAPVPRNGTSTWHLFLHRENQAIKEMPHRHAHGPS